MIRKKKGGKMREAMNIVVDHFCKEVEGEPNQELIKDLVFQLHELVDKSCDLETTAPLALLIAFNRQTRDSINNAAANLENQVKGIIDQVGSMSFSNVEKRARAVKALEILYDLITKKEPCTHD